MNKELQELLSKRTIVKQEDRQNAINIFKEQMTESFKHKNHAENKTNIYNTALEYAKNALFDCITLSFGEILEEFSTFDNILDQSSRAEVFYPKYKSNYRIQNISAEQNVILLPIDIEIPTRYDKESGKKKPIEFRVSWMYRNDDFIKKCNDYYSKFDLFIEFTNLNRNKWKIELKTKNNVITRP